ncbi:MAG: hypothetical protein E6I70_06950 [Chloroflexi bacterium]|nr:MAG: hypothetical protein E6I70_06950 [Chloroflexota bacterium]
MPRWARSVAIFTLVLTACTGTSTPVPVPSALPIYPAEEPTPTAPPVPLVGPPQYRALWVDAFHDGIKTKAQVNTLIDRAHRANLNALFVQVRKRGDAYFNLGLEPRADDPALARRPFDPLAYLVDRAHRANPRLEVHAWVNTFFVGKDSAVYQTHGDEWGNRTAGGDTGGYLDPGVPQARTYTREVFVDLIKSYKVDGIHFDFVRYPDGGDWGYSPLAVANFNAATGKTGSPDPTDADWQQWRRDQVTAFVRDTYHALHLARPEIKVSGALIAYGKGPRNESEWRQTATYTSVLQDWYSWLREGILDFGVPMNYDRDSSPSQNGWYRLWNDFEKDRLGKVLIGVGAFLNYPEDTITQIRQGLQATPGGNHALGIAIYSYASTSVYGTDDFYLAPNDQGYLPRQPYAPNPDPIVLANRARSFNTWFYTALSVASSYDDPVVGKVPTTPVFEKPAPIPTLGSG